MSPECHISFFHLTHTNITLTHYKSNKILVLPIKGSITFRSAPLIFAPQRFTRCGAFLYTPFQCSAYNLPTPFHLF